MQLKPGMLLHVTLMALLVAIAVVATASTAVASYSSQGTALPTTAELTTNKDSLNGIVFDMSYDSWSTMYQSLKQSDQYDWMDWSTDNCSGPDVGRHDTFQHPCLRHDLSWRNLALIDQATGRVWNERNRYAANKQFLWDMEDACDQDSTILIVRNACKGIADSIYYTAVRQLAGYRIENAVERTHFTANQKFDVINGGGTLPGSAAVSCAHGNLTDRENSTNRCLPIYRLELKGKPFAPQRISRFPSGTELQLQVVRANLQSIKGPPYSYSATLTAYEPLNTGDLHLWAKYPLMISESSNITCSNSSTYTYVYADQQNYALPHPNDQLLKSTLVYLKMCRVTTLSEESSELLEIHPVQAIPLQNGSYHPSIGDRVNHQEGIKIALLTANLSPDPDTSIFNNSDTLTVIPSTPAATLLTQQS